MDKNKIIIRNSDNIEIDGYLFFIPEKYTANMDIGKEYKIIFNYILARVIHSKIHTEYFKMESFNKIQMEKCIIIAERIFAFIITGKLDKISFNNLEKDLIDKIPISLIPKINPFIVERLD